MANHAFDFSADSELLQRFLHTFRLPDDGSPREQLKRIARAFARLPYENLTKIIKGEEAGQPGLARRMPAEVLADHATSGAGGTCFSLTATLLQLVRSLGFRAEPILADRSYGQNTHCALVVWLDQRPHLIDPGYLIVTPIPLGRGDQEQRVRTAFNELILTPCAADRLELATVQNGARRTRLTFKTRPADPSEFLRAWDESFDWEMMQYPLLTRVAGDRQLYLNGQRFQVRTPDAVEREQIDREHLVERVSREFGIRPQVVYRALTILERKGAGNGRSPTG